MKWRPTRYCTEAGYESARKALWGMRLIENAFCGFDTQLQVMLAQMQVMLRTKIDICAYSSLCVSARV